MEHAAIRIPISSAETSAPLPELKLHVEEPETAESSFELILGDTEIINYPGCTQYRAQVIRTLDDKAFNIIDTIIVTVAKGQEDERQGARLFSKAFINHTDVPNLYAFIESEGDIDSEVANHMEQLRKNMERQMSQR